MSKFFKYTKGPWIIQGHPYYVFNILAPNPKNEKNPLLIAIIRDGNWGVDPIERDYNAKLIGHAPEMFEALLELEKEYKKNYPSDINASEIVKNILEKIRGK